jgi:hypothetical protein
MDMDVYNRLELKKKARVIRNLCAVRTDCERHYDPIALKMKYDAMSIASMPDLVRQESIMQLSNDGVSCVKYSTPHIRDQVVELNRLINERIGSCKDLFPEWVEWECIKTVFIMPNGLTPEGVFASGRYYHTNLNRYPYQVYLNWTWGKRDDGNLLYNDEKFLRLLYERFAMDEAPISRTADVSDAVKSIFYDFVLDGDGVDIIVDCENTDPYKFCAALTSLSSEELNTVNKIVLCDDVHTPEAWRALSVYVDLPIEHVMTKRVNARKSLVDIRLTALVCNEFLNEDVNSFVLVSSDSDFWGLIESLPQARFLVMLEDERTSASLKETLKEHGVFYCFIERFYSGTTTASEIMYDAVIREVNRVLASATIDVSGIMSEAIASTRAPLSASEQRILLDHAAHNLSMQFNQDGKAEFSLPRYVPRKGRQ